MGVCHTILFLYMFERFHRKILICIRLDPVVPKIRYAQRMFTGIIFIIMQMGKQPKHPTKDRVNKL